MSELKPNIILILCDQLKASALPLYVKQERQKITLIIGGCHEESCQKNGELVMMWL